MLCHHSFSASHTTYSASLPKIFIGWVSGEKSRSSAVLSIKYLIFLCFQEGLWTARAVSSNSPLNNCINWVYWPPSSPECDSSGRACAFSIGRAPHPSSTTTVPRLEGGNLHGTHLDLHPHRLMREHEPVPKLLYPCICLTSFPLTWAKDWGSREQQTSKWAEDGSNSPATALLHWIGISFLREYRCGFAEERRHFHPFGLQDCDQETPGLENQRKQLSMKSLVREGPRKHYPCIERLGGSLQEISMDFRSWVQVHKAQQVFCMVFLIQWVLSHGRWWEMGSKHWGAAVLGQFWMLFFFFSFSLWSLQETCEDFSSWVQVYEVLRILSLTSPFPSGNI